jgi:hypothetical protein
MSEADLRQLVQKQNEVSNLPCYCCIDNRTKYTQRLYATNKNKSMS